MCGPLHPIHRSTPLHPPSTQHHEYAEFRSALELLEVGACLVCRGALLCNANTIYRVMRVQVTGHVDRIAKIEAADPAIDVSQFKRVS